MSERHLFTEVDDCIVAAYKYVTKTGYKVENFAEIRGKDKQLTVGLLAEDGELFMMYMQDHNSSTKRKLRRKIHDANCTLPRFINNQLLPFL